MIGTRKAMTFSFIPAAEQHDLGDDIRELFAELASTLKHEHRAFTGECHPSVDVRETDETIEVVVDVPGMPQEALRVIFRRDVLVIAGEKAPPQSTDDQTFHLVEREFGRFARAIRLEGAFDIAQATARLQRGALVVTLRKIPDRRGQAHQISITTGPAR
jgi:HSP20 family protein